MLFKRGRFAGVISDPRDATLAPHYQEFLFKSAAILKSLFTRSRKNFWHRSSFPAHHYSGQHPPCTTGRASEEPPTRFGQDHFFVSCSSSRQPLAFFASIPRSSKHLNLGTLF